MWARAAGILDGYPDNTFRPTATVSRQAVAAMAHRINAWGVVHGPFTGRT